MQLKGSALAALAAALPLAMAGAQVATVDYSDAGTVPGRWSYVSVAGGSEARFTDSGGAIRFLIGCARATRRVTVARTSGAPGATLSLWTTDATRDLPARFEQNAMRVSAQLAAYDPLLDAIAFTRGRIALSMPGSPALVLAPGPEAARVIEDCRA